VFPDDGKEFRENQREREEHLSERRIYPREYINQNMTNGPTTEQNRAEQISSSSSLLKSSSSFLCGKSSLFNKQFSSKRPLFFFVKKTIIRSIEEDTNKRERRRKTAVFVSREEVMSKVTTRAQKRRRGERDVWDLIVNNDDICFKHILPRLNSNDVKFLYGVNEETRKLVKRSSRAGDLKERFKVNEMSSISTLEIAWENRENKSLWPSYWDETWFCREVARTNKLELLKWAREEKECEWDEWTICEAADHGNLEMVKYCVANKCPISVLTCACAAEYGHLEVLKYLREEVKAPLYWETAVVAAENGHLHILEYLVERKFDDYDVWACQLSAENGHLDCLKYLHETAKAPWDDDAVREAHENDHPECLQYCLDNNCPLPEGWSYVNGELHVPDH